MTKAMPFLQKVILLSYDPRPFALAIFFPFSPDDFLCALAGTTKMSFRTFVLIIIFGKPVSIMLYSIFLQTGWNLLLPGV